MAEFQFVKPGLNAVGQYQLSGIPFLSSSINVHANTGSADFTTIAFPTVTKFVTVSNTNTGTNAPLRVAFSTNAVKAVTGHYFDLDNGESYTGEWRVAELYMLGVGAPTSASVIAGCSMVGLENLPGNWSGSDDGSIYNPGIG
jgi:hypothetical protein